MIDAPRTEKPIHLLLYQVATTYYAQPINSSTQQTFGADTLEELAEKAAELNVTGVATWASPTERKHPIVTETMLPLPKLLIDLFVVNQRRLHEEFRTRVDRLRASLSTGQSSY